MGRFQYPAVNRNGKTRSGRRRHAFPEGHQSRVHPVQRHARRRSCQRKNVRRELLALRAGKHCGIVHECRLSRRQKQGDPWNHRRRRRNQSEIIGPNVRESGFLPSCGFVRKKVKCLVLLDRPANCCTGLHAGVRLFHGIHRSGRGVHFHGERVPRLERLVPQESKDVAMHVIRAALGDNIDDPAHGPAILRVVVAQDNLKLLHCFLRDRGTDSVYRIIHCVRPIHRHFVGPRALPADI